MSTRRSSRDGVLLLAFLFLNSIPVGYMNVIPLVYLLQVHYDPSLIGEIYAASAISNTICLTPFGFLADKYGRKKFLIVGGALPFVSYVIFALTLDPNWLIVASVIGGVGLAGGIAVAMNGPAFLPLLAGATSDEKRTALFSASQGVWAVALAIGSFSSVVPDYLSSTLSESSFLAHSQSYYLMAALTIVSVIPIFFVKEEKGRVPPPKVKRSEISTRGIQRRFRRSFLSAEKLLSPSLVSGRKIARFSLVYALSGLGLGVIVQLMATWYNLRFGVSESVAGLWIGFAEIITVAAIVAIPRLVRARGTLWIAVITGIISSVFLGAMPLSSIFEAAAVLFIFRNVFVNISWPVLQSYMMGIVHEKERASTVGITTTAWGFANSVGTLVGGALLGVGLLNLPFAIGVVGYAGSAIALWLLFRGEKPPEESKKKKISVQQSPG